MITILIATGDGQAVQYEEDQVRAMLQQGLLRDDVLFWKEGMGDWQPLRRLLEKSLPPAIPTRPEPPLNQLAGTMRAGPIRIEGWLTVFCVILTILSPIAIIGQMVFIWNQVQSAIVAYPLLRGVCIWENLGSTVLMIYGFLVGCTMLSGSPRGREIAKRFLITRFLSFLGVEIVALVMMRNLPASMLEAGIFGVLGQLLHVLFFTVLWWFYFKNSKRVMATYGEPKPRKTKVRQK